VDLDAQRRSRFGKHVGGAAARRPALDRLALRLAHEEPDIYRSATGRSGGAETVLEGIARALAAPVTRRGAVKLAGGAVLAGSLLRPASALGQDCYPGGPKVCESPNGQKVCVSGDLACCNSDLCAYACGEPWRVCESPANCSDTAAMCQPPYATTGSKFCSQRVSYSNHCAGGSATRVVGWCCREIDDCGVNIGDCRCPPSRVCGDTSFSSPQCCEPDEDCVPTPDGKPGYCAPRCTNGGYRCFAGQCCGEDEDCCGADCCDPDHICCGGDAAGDWCCPRSYGCLDTRGTCGCLAAQKCGSQCCETGTTCCTEWVGDYLGERQEVPGGYCCGPQPSRLDQLGRSLGRALSDLFSALAPFATGSRASATTAAAVPGSADALVAVGAVASLAALAQDTIRSSRVDHAYRRPVKVLRPRLARIAPGAGVDASAAHALDRVLAAEARAWALVYAAAVARGRSLGAIRAGKVRTARAQAHAFGHFASRAAKALRALPPLRRAAARALQQSGTPEVTMTLAEIRSGQAAVKAHGLPADLRARLRQLGLGRAEQRRVAKILIGAKPRTGPVFIAPLADASRFNPTAKLLARAAARSRKQPIVVSRARPGKIRASRAHVAGSRPRASGSWRVRSRE
jgi:hypothetical protein